MSCSRRKCWKFFLGNGSPGKGKNNGIQEVVGSTPIGSTNQISNLNVAQILSDRHFHEIVRVLSVFVHALARN